MPANATGALGFQVNGDTVSTSSPAYTAGQSSALELNGSDGMTTTLAMDPATFPNMTINAWVEVTAWNYSGFDTNIVACFDGTDGGFYRGIGFVSPSGGGSEGQWQVQVGDECWSTGFSLSLDQWYNVTVSYSSTNIVFSCNGEQASFGSPGTFGPASADMTVGFDEVDGGPQYLTGYLNEVEVWRTALTGAEESQVWNSGAGITSNYPAAAELIAGYHMTTSSGDTVPDFTGNGYSGSLFGDASIVSGTGFQQVATYQTTFSSLGDQQIAAVYTAGTDDSYTDDTSYFDETVLNDSATTFVDTATTGTQGQPVTLTVDVTGSGSTPAGVVNFYAGTDENLFLGSAPLSVSDSTASATLTTTEIPPGSQTITAAYMGDNDPNMPESSTAGDFYAASSVTTTITVTAFAAPTLTSSQSAVPAGQTVDLTATMPPAAAPGNIQFEVNGSDVGSPVSLTSPVDTESLSLDGTYGLNTEVAMPESGDLTIDSWVKVTGWNDGGFNIVASFDGTGGGYCPAVGYFSGGDWMVQVGTECWDTGIAVALGQWANVAVTFSGTDIVFYCDGQSRSFGSAGSFTATDGTMTIGYDAVDGGPQYMTGELSEFDVWQAALTSTQIAAMNNGGNGFCASSTSDYTDSSQMLDGFHLSGDTSDFVTTDTVTSTGSGESWATSDTPSYLATATYSGAELSSGLNQVTAVYSPDGSGYADSTSAALPLIGLATTLTGTITNAAPMQSTPSPLADGSLVQSVSYTTGSLNYVSNSVGTATVSVDAALGTTEEDGDPLTAVGVQVKLNGSDDWENTVYYAVPSEFDGSTDYRFTVPINNVEGGLPTGTYSYSMKFIGYSSDDSGGTQITTVSSPDATIASDDATGNVNVLNRNESDLGQGWNLNGLDSLTLQTDGGPEGVTFVQSDGTMGFFKYYEDSYIAPAGPFAFMTLTTDGSGYALQDRQREAPRSSLRPARYSRLQTTTAT